MNANISRGFVVCLAALGPWQAAFAQVETPRCGGLGERNCHVTDAEFWANDSGFCDRGLKPSIGLLRVALGESATCVNDTRNTESGRSWAAWALTEQLNHVQGDVPINHTFRLATHNSYSNMRDGYRSLLSANQYYSITDQLNLGARSIRIDPWFYFGEARVCHGSRQVDCELQAALPIAGLAVSLTPLAGWIPILPPAIKPLLPVGFAFASTVKVNNRLYANAIKEVGQWLDAHPGEIITLIQNDYVPLDKVSLIHKPIETFLGSKVFRPIDLYDALCKKPGSCQSMAGEPWPSANQIRALGKQVIIFNSTKGGNSEVERDRQRSSYTYDSVLDASGNPFWMFRYETYTEKPSSFWGSPVAYGRCDKIDEVPPPPSTRGDLAKGEWLRGGEGRSGSDLINDRSTAIADLVTAEKIPALQACGVNEAGLDFFMALSQAPFEFREEKPDARREAAIWSFAPGETGKAGPSYMRGTDGRWLSDSPGRSKRVACKGVRINTFNNLDVHRWDVTSSATFFQAGATCESKGMKFAPPTNIRDNDELRRVLARDGVSEAWLNYSVKPVPSAIFDPASISNYVDRQGALSDELTFNINGFPDVTFTSMFGQNDLSLLRLAPGTSGEGSLAEGPVEVNLEYDQLRSQAAPNGAYTTTVSLLPVRDSVPKPAVSTTVVTHVLEPTASTLTVEPTAAGSPLHHLRATIKQQCGDTTGDGFRPSGLVDFVDEFQATPASPKQQKPLGTLRLRSNDPSPVKNGTLTSFACSGIDATHSLCASTALEPGIHRISAVYNRSADFNSSTSDPVEVIVGGPVTPPALDFTFAPQQFQVKEQIVTFPSRWRAVSAESNLSGVSAAVSNSNSVRIAVQPVLASGDYRGIVRIGYFEGTEPSAFLRYHELPVHLSVGGTFSVPTAPLQFLSLSGDSKQTIPITTDGGAPIIAVSTESGGNWLDATSDIQPGPQPARQATNGLVSVIINAAGLVSGDYRGRVDVSVTGQAPVSIPVMLRVAYSTPQFRISTNPPNVPIEVDGVLRATPGEFAPIAHTLEAPAYQVLSSGVRAKFVRWSTGDTERRLKVPAGPGSIEAIYSLQYEFQGLVNPTCGGQLSAKRAWVDANAALSVTATPSSQYPFFAGFQGPIESSTPGNRTARIIMDRPKGVKANFCKTANCPLSNASPTVSVASNPPITLLGYGVAPVTLSFNSTTASVVRYTLTGAVNQTATVNVPGAITVSTEGLTTMTYTPADALGTQGATNQIAFTLVRPMSVSAAVSPSLNASGWHTSDVNITFAVTGGANQTIRYQLLGAVNRLGQGASGMVVPITAEGETTVTYWADDISGQVTPRKTLTVRIEKRAPTVSGLPAAGCKLTPADGRMVDLGIISSAAASGIKSFDLRITSTEPAPASDIQILDQPTGKRVLLRATTSSTNGRTYRFAALATTVAGASAAASGSCDVASSTPTVPGDVNGDGVVNCADVAAIRAALGAKPGDPRFSARLDVVVDNVIDVRDLQFVAQRLAAGTVCTQ